MFNSRLCIFCMRPAGRMFLNSGLKRTVISQLKGVMFFCKVGCIMFAAGPLND
jgi:hypothetical protein